MLVNLDGAKKNVLVDKQHGQNWKVLGFSSGLGRVGWGSWTHKSRLELAFLSFHCYHVSSCFLACLSFRLPKAHSEDVRNKYKLYKLEVDSDTDMKASIDFI